ncbi:hypothetical protein X474_16840 [Dethiosulfatarculus sandiegensis]|uniref:Uncharacterized protein n=1 Tax=Dethiosulfatarculus sandiegensis TaxID=1429043 RepID=A0A0D2J3W8_9BACT|nr:hypothetical protein X474_16840 [Dethiosulfatarculus sandiegensis]
MLGTANRSWLEHEALTRTQLLESGPEKLPKRHDMTVWDK